MRKFAGSQSATVRRMPSIPLRALPPTSLTCLYLTTGALPPGPDGVPAERHAVRVAVPVTAASQESTRCAHEQKEQS